LLKSGKKFKWTDEHDTSFRSLKEKCAERLTLTPIQSGVPFELYTDASSVACGAALLQGDKIIEFFSRKFTPTEQRYSAFERETLALVTSVLHFRNILLGMKFTIFTDHKPLKQWLKKPPVNERHARWLVRLQDMTFEIEYIEGRKNVLADLMSRPPNVAKSSYEELHSEINVHAIKLNYMNDIVQEAQTDEFVRSCGIPEEYIEVVNNLKYSMVSGFPRLLLPLKFTQEVCDLVHNLGHFGVKRTLNTIARQYFWPGMRKQISDTVRACQSCQINKIVKPQRRVVVH
jgi:hypothetical protein